MSVLSVLCVCVFSDAHLLSGGHRGSRRNLGRRRVFGLCLFVSLGQLCFVWSLWQLISHTNGCRRWSLAPACCVRKGFISELLSCTVCDPFSSSFRDSGTLVVYLDQRTQTDVAFCSGALLQISPPGLLSTSVIFKPNQAEIIVLIK